MFGFLKNILKKPVQAPAQHDESEISLVEPGADYAPATPPPPPPVPRQQRQGGGYQPQSGYQQGGYQQHGGYQHGGGYPQTSGYQQKPGYQQNQGYQQPYQPAQPQAYQPAPQPTFQPPPQPAPQPAFQNGGAQRAAHPMTKSVEVSLQAVLQGLPVELQSRVLNVDVGGAVIHIPLERVLSQLSRGSVKISFGELRQIVPQIFSPEPDKDKVAVPLPLGELLSKINPALIARRRVQKQVEVPSDISSPFENGNFGFQGAPAKPEPAPAPVHQPRANPIPFGAPTPPAGRSAITSTPTPPPPAAPAMPPTMVSPSRGFNDLSNHQTSPPPAAPTPPPAHTAPAVAPLIPMSQKPRNTPGQASGPTPVIVSLIALAEGWPETIRKEIVQLNLVEAKVHLPADAVEQGLKQGRIAFTWKTLRSWMPGLALPASPHDAATLELPLKVVAPAFLGRQKEAGKQQQKIAIDSEIPNLFFGFPQPGAGNAPAPAPTPAPEASPVSKPAPVDTNYYIWDDSDDRVAGDPAKQSSPGTSFVTRYATPNEVVSRAASLDGVAGALIALPDGLMVASRLSPDLNGDTLAAFLPHIFSKVSQCTKELRMGELNNLNFTVGNVPWKIFRVNAIFFAAFGRAGEALPTASLASLAAELDHKAN